MSEQELNDIGLNFLRTQLVTVPGASIPYPYGGKQRQVMVDLDPRLLQSKGLAPIDIVNTLGQQNIVLPSGTAKIGEFEYDVAANASPRTVAELNDLPIKVVNNATVYIRDVAHVRDGFSPQTNVVRQDGQRGTLVTVLKTGAASTVDVVQGIRNLLPRVIPTLPPALRIQLLADQSIFVKAAVSGVNGVSYNLATQTPQYRIQSLSDIENIAITAAGAPAPGATPAGTTPAATPPVMTTRPGILADVASITRSSEMATVSHYNIRRVVDIYGAVQDRDLGSVGRDVARIVEANRKLLPRGSFLTVRGQIETMRTAYIGLLAGLAFAIVLVYLLIVVNFQS
jgi:multidrug efflux pump subunit AcrB